MARTADPQSDSPHTADGGRHRSPPNQREPAAAAVVLTPKGQRRLAARAAWLATGPIPRFSHHYLDDPALHSVAMLRAAMRAAPGVLG